MYVQLKCTILTAAAQSCGLRGNVVPSFQNYVADDDIVLGRITVGYQAIIPSYKFSCQDEMCGNITEWGVDVSPSGGTHQGAYTLNLQVWRPSPTVDDSTGAGCYTLAGNNRFSAISLSNGVAVVTPSPQNYIQFRDGDVLGVYVEETGDTVGGVVYLSNVRGHSVWLAPTPASSRNGDCPYTAGQNGDLNTLQQAAPIISIKTGKHYSLS